MASNNRSRRRPNATGPLASVAQLRELEDAVARAVNVLSDRLTVIEHALSSVIETVYPDPEPADNVSGHDRAQRDIVRSESDESFNYEDHEPGVAGADFLVQGEAAAQMAREEAAEEAGLTDEEWARREAARILAEGDWEGEGGR